MRRAFALWLVFFLCVVAPSFADWTLVKIGGRDYVPLDDVAEFYGWVGASFRQ